MLHIPPTIYQLLPLRCSTIAIQKAKTNWRIFRSKEKERKKTIITITDYKLKNDETERARGLGRKIKEEIGKGNKMTALRFQTSESHQTCQSSLRGKNNPNRNS